MAEDLLNELNLDDAELTTLQALVNSATDIVKNSAANVDETSQTTITAVKTLATQMYYDRTLTDGMSRGLMMMLTHLQAQGNEANEAGKAGDADGSNS